MMNRTLNLYSYDIRKGYKSRMLCLKLVGLLLSRPRDNIVTHNLTQVGLDSYVSVQALFEILLDIGRL